MECDSGSDDEDRPCSCRIAFRFDRSPRTQRVVYDQDLATYTLMILKELVEDERVKAEDEHEDDAPRIQGVPTLRSSKGTLGNLTS